jgi:hypothetical protein
MVVAQRRIGPLRVAAVTLLFSSLGLFFWATTHYQETCPTTPDEQSGAVYPLDEHGRFVYLTLSEHRTVVAAQTFYIAMWLCAGAVEIRHGWLRRKERTAPILPG